MTSAAKETIPMTARAETPKRGSVAAIVGGLAGALLAGIGAGCVPVIPDCDCGDGGVVSFPDESKLDRSEECILSGPDECGYPGEQGSLYGYQEGDIFANFEAMNCDGEPAEFAEYFQERPDNGELNKAIIFSLGAEWSVPCREEAELFAAQAEERRAQNVEFLHLLHENEYNGAPTQETCLAWFESEEVANSAYPVLYDPTNAIDELMKAGESALPILLAVDANGHIRLREGGQAITETELNNIIDEIVSDPYGS
jgi:alkyl hydroperoxide reductase subunit AhpC